MSFGENLKKIRLGRGLSQNELADRLFITSTMISAIEAGRREPSLALALGMAKVLGTSVEAIAGKEN